MVAWRAGGRKAVGAVGAVQLTTHARYKYVQDEHSFFESW